MIVSKKNKLSIKIEIFTFYTYRVSFTFKIGILDFLKIY